MYSFMVARIALWNVRCLSRIRKTSVDKTTWTEILWTIDAPKIRISEAGAFVPRVRYRKGDFFVADDMASITALYANGNW